MRRFSLLILVLFLCGCAGFSVWTKVSGEYKDSARGFSAVLPSGWMRYNHIKYFIATRDGVVLENIVVQKLYFDDELEHTKKKFFEGMMLEDLAEIEIDNYKSSDQINRFELDENKPVAIADKDGFRIKYSYYSKGGLKIVGIHYGLMHNEDVYRIRYEAAAQHYFKKYLGNFEKFVESFKLI